MVDIKKWFGNFDMRSWFFVIGIFLLWGMTQINFNPVEYLRLVAPILLGASFVLLGVFAIADIRKTIKEHLSRKTRNTLKDIEGMRHRQEHKDLEEQISIDREVLSLRESLRGFKRTYFENCVIYSAILFAITLLLTFIDIGVYIQTSNFILMVIFFLWGLYYFARMLQYIFFALNIVKLDD